MAVVSARLFRFDLLLLYIFRQHQISRSSDNGFDNFQVFVVLLYVFLFTFRILRKKCFKISNTDQILLMSQETLKGGKWSGVILRSRTKLAISNKTARTQKSPKNNANAVFAKHLQMLYFWNETAKNGTFQVPWLFKEEQKKKIAKIMLMNKVNNNYFSMIIISAAAATARREEWLWTSWRVSSVSNFCLPGCCSRGYWYCWCLYCCYWCCCCCHGCCADIVFAQYIHM